MLSIYGVQAFAAALPPESCYPDLNQAENRTLPGVALRLV